MKSFKSYIKESKEECGLRYGKILFGEIFGKKEKDTSEEQDLLSMLRTYFINGYRSKDIDTALHQLKQCKTVFKKQLYSGESYMYRHLRFKNQKDYREGISSHLMKKLEVEVIRPGKEWAIRNNKKFHFYIIGQDQFLSIKNIPYYPKYTVESWAAERRNSFSENSRSDYFVKTEVDENDVIFDVEFLDQLKVKLDSYPGEVEFLRINNSPIKNCEYHLHINANGWSYLLYDILTKLDPEYKYKYRGIDTVYWDKTGTGDIYISTEPRRDDL